MHLKKVKLSEILRTGPQAERFLFTYRPRLEELVDSIERIGILHPPLLLNRREQGHYQIICGSRRVKALCQLGEVETPAFIVEQEECREVDCFRWSLLDNRFCRGFNEIERAMLFVRLQDTLPNLLPELEDVLGNDLRPPREPEIQAQYRALLGLPNEIKDALALDDITLGHAILLLKATQECQSLFFSWVIQCALNTNEARQAIHWAMEIANRDAKDLREHLACSTFLEILSSRSSPRHKAQQLLLQLRKDRFPLVERWRSTFEEAREKAGVGKWVQIIHDPFFETSEISFQIRASSQAELENKLRSLVRAAEEGRTLDLFRGVSVEGQE